MAIFEIKSDLTKIRLEQYNLPANFNFSTTTIGHGEWITLSSGKRVAKLTADPGTTERHNTFPVYTSTDRADVKLSNTITIPQGDFRFETDNYTGTVAVGTLMTVQIHATASNGGTLEPAATGEAVRAIVEDVDSTRTTITCRMLDGVTLAP